MTLFQNKYRVETTRLKNWDYASDGWYYITICAKGHKNVLGKIQHGIMQLNKYGRIAEQCWFDLPNHYSNLVLDAFVLMPDHLHGIMKIDNKTYGTVNGNKFVTPVDTGLKPVSTGFKPVSTANQHGISEFIRAFKTFSTRRMNELDNTPGKSWWQLRFYDHVIRNEKELHRIREYIVKNPSKWKKY